MIHLWFHLEKVLTQYNDILDQRAKIKQNVDNIRTQNLELQCTLQSLLQDDVNNELIMPPAASLAPSNLSTLQGSKI